MTIAESGQFLSAIIASRKRLYRSSKAFSNSGVSVGICSTNAWTALDLVDRRQRRLSPSQPDFGAYVLKLTQLAGIEQIVDPSGVCRRRHFGQPVISHCPISPATDEIAGGGLHLLVV